MAFSSTELFRYSKLESKSNDFPTIILTEEAKAFFNRAVLEGSLDTKGVPLQYGQGLVGIAWVGKNDKKEEVVYIDLLPAFNKNDNLFKKDKHGVEYKEHEYAYTDELMGGNSGRNHEKLLSIITARIQSAYDLQNSDVLAKYDGLYIIQDNKVLIDKRKLFGFGIFKGDEKTLLHSIRYNSTNLNPHSIQYNPEFLLLYYFLPDEVIDDNAYIHEYFIKRHLPLSVCNNIMSALLQGLPLEDKHTSRSIKTDMNNEFQVSVNSWLQIKDNPEEKAKLLLETLVRFCYMETPKIEKIKEIIFYMRQNIQSISLDPTQQNTLLSELLDTPPAKISAGEFTFRDKTAWELVIDNNYTEIMHFLADVLNDSVLEQALLYAIDKNHIDIIYLLLQKNIITDRLRITNALIDSIEKGNVELSEIFKNKECYLEAPELLLHHVSKGLTEVVRKGDYRQFNKIIKEHKELDLMEQEDYREGIDEILFDHFNENIKCGDLHNLMQMEAEFPEFFQTFTLDKEEEAKETSEEYKSINLAIFYAQDNVLTYLMNAHFHFLSVETKTLLLEECLKNKITELMQELEYEEVQKVLNEMDAEVGKNYMLEQFWHCVSSSLDNLKELRKYFPEIYLEFLSDTNEYDQTPLLLTINHKRHDIIAYLLEEKNNAVNVRNGINLTPLMLAAVNADLNSIQLLIQHGANTEEMNEDKDFIHYLNMGLITLAKGFQYNNIIKIHTQYPQVDLTWENSSGESVKNIIAEHPDTSDLAFFENSESQKRLEQLLDTFYSLPTPILKIA
jgi:ankyrin repeat protein